MGNKEQELFEQLTDQGILNRDRDVPGDVLWNAPQGKIRHDRLLNKELETYKVRDPTPQTDLLQDAERQYVIPYVMTIAPLLRVPPIIDEVYKCATNEMLDNGLFCVLSRSYVKRLSNGVLLWDPFFVIIKRKIVVRIRCLYNPNSKQFRLKEIHLWQNNTSSYYRIADKRLGWELVPGIIEKYIEYEGIFHEESSKTVG